MVKVIATFLNKGQVIETVCSESKSRIVASKDIIL